VRLYCEAIAQAATKGGRAAVVDSGADIGSFDEPVAEEAVVEA
jgi:small subunit ribosomal protein S2